MIKLHKKNYSVGAPKSALLPIDTIAPNPNQPRKYFEEEAMASLADSIAEYGVLQPITVRKKNGAFELVAGERRYRAAIMAGLTEIPAIIIRGDSNKSAILALLENLQREDLSFFEIAESYRHLLKKQGITQTELAEKVGKSQSSIANKIRLLRLPPLVKKLIRDYDLTERHARALLMLTDKQKQLEVVKAACRDNLSANETEKMIHDINEKEKKMLMPKREVRVSPANDMKLFKNTVSKAVGVIKKSGIEAEMEENSFDWGTEYVIKVKNTVK